MNADRLNGLNFVHRFAELPEFFYTRLAPQGLPTPRLVHASPSAAALIGLSENDFKSPHWADYFSGNTPLPGSQPLAAVYSGHQFGVWAGQLGDGRAHLLGGVLQADQHWELQLKGAGPTPYSRFADGRAVLRSSIREYLCSEAMAALGIPTTRALSLVASPLPVRRERWETAAVVCRMAPSFVRFGSFQHWAAAENVEALQALADHVIEHFRPELREAGGNVYAGLLADVTRRTAELMADWMAVGFMHGVMNTDNMSILGVTLDYGPFGFMETFDPGHICNHSDPSGRYAYSAQPAVGHWNCLALAQALSPLIGAAAAEIVQDHYADAFAERFESRMRAKLGLREPDRRDAALIRDLLQYLTENQVDYPQFFRALSHLSVAADTTPVRALFRDPAAADVWLQDWHDRVQAEGLPDAVRQAAMRAVNPKFVLRNWLAEEVIRQAEAGDDSGVARLYDCLSRPFEEQPENVAWAEPGPAWSRNLAVSCSS